ncbi:CpcT/CpeT family chromophore lyase [Colwellia sp. UCD-KL20]|uniref:CpcT/CpeT family chromophore lyase n=1 Tax=Colwellia sp. UCD-KL20 TaxID=1917165 RepID=UPI000970B420|nr:CpcT/CpeT family chromophore lyase [Colwellia sp. UCD-KL20]
MIKTYLFISLCSFILTSNAYGIDKRRQIDKLLKKFDSLVQGEFDNYNQVNFEENDFLAKDDKPQKKHARLYKRVVRINAPTLGEHVYYHQIHDAGKNQPAYRKSIEVLSVDDKKQMIIAENYRFKSPEDIKNLWESNKIIDIRYDDLRKVGEQCYTEYQLVGKSFVGSIDQNRCKVHSKKFGYINLRTQEVISESELWHLEEGFLPSGEMLFGREDDIPIKMRRAKNFTCWAALKTDKLKPNGEFYWDLFSNIVLHNQGDIMKISTTEKVPKHYFIRLKETIFPAGDRPDVFEMFIHDKNDSDTKALAYTWTNTEATHLGINLRWMQSACSLIKKAN